MPTTVAYQSTISCKRVVFRLAWCRVGRLMALPSDPCDICLLLWCCLDETHLCDESRLLLERYSHRTLSPVHTRPRITGLRMRPMRSISTSTTSPSCKKSGGVRLNPTPDGVPVAMISPGSSVMRQATRAHSWPRTETRQGKDLLQRLLPLLEKRTHGEVCLPAGNLRTTQEICTRINRSLLMRDTCTPRSEEHTSELQSPCNLVCRLLLEKKKKKIIETINQ